jgi:hypothetical protein
MAIAKHAFRRAGKADAFALVQRRITSVSSGVLQLHALGAQFRRPSSK